LYAVVWVVGFSFINADPLGDWRSARALQTGDHLEQRENLFKNDFLLGLTPIESLAQPSDILQTYPTLDYSLQNSTSKIGES
jgi:hypothetical protein